MPLKLSRDQRIAAFDRLETTTALGITIPLPRTLNDLPLGIQDEYRDLRVALGQAEMGESKFATRLFCLMTLHPQASEVVPPDVLEGAFLTDAERLEVRLAVTSILGSLRKHREEANDEERERAERNTRQESDEGNAPPGELPDSTSSTPSVETEASTPERSSGSTPPASSTPSTTPSPNTGTSTSTEP